MDFVSLVNFVEYLDAIRALKDYDTFSSIDETIKQTVRAYIREIHQVFKEETENNKKSTMDLLSALSANNKNLYFSKLGSWFQCYCGKIAPLLIEKLIEGGRVDHDCAERLIVFYEETKIDIRTKCALLYFLAMSQCVEDPLFAYYHSLGAFKAYPRLGEALGQKYIYNPEELVEQCSDICPICGEEESTPHYCVPQILAIGEDQKLSPIKLWTKCDRCRNIYAYNFPVSMMGEMNGHYTTGNEKRVIQPRYPLRIYGDIFNKCKQYTEGTKYLEIGVGNGEMLACAMEMGFEADAVEICKEDCINVSSALGVDIKWCDFMEFETNKKYDVIIMGDVLEHVSQPVKALQKAYDLLSEKGVFWLSTPNFNSSFSRLMKFEDAMWNQKNHFTYFSFETLKPILAGVGFEVLHYDISNRYNGSMELFCRKINS